MQMNTLFELGWRQFFQSQLDFDSLASLLPVRVMSVQRNRIICLGLDSQGLPLELDLSTYHWRNEQPEAHPTVGDWLMIDLEYQPLFLLERKSLIKRRSAGRESLVQLVAANIDILFIVTSCNHDFNLNRIERYLSLAAESTSQAVLVLTKTDLCEDVTTYTDALMQHHSAIPVEQVNATDPDSLQALEKWISKGETIALVGSSGVGKSTIINGLKGEALQATGAIREDDSKGRHTTTSRSLHRLAGGGLLIDNPGIRELQLVDSEQGVKSTFADIEELAKECRYKDCHHLSEPGCAVLLAVESGELDPRRLDNYQKLMAEQTRNSESLVERRSKDRALGKFYKNAKISSKRFKSREG